MCGLRRLSKEVPDFLPLCESVVITFIIYYTAPLEIFNFPNPNFESDPCIPFCFLFTALSLFT